MGVGKGSLSSKKRVRQSEYTGEGTVILVLGGTKKKQSFKIAIKADD